MGKQNIGESKSHNTFAFYKNRGRRKTSDRKENTGWWLGESIMEFTNRRIL